MIEMGEEGAALRQPPKKAPEPPKEPEQPEEPDEDKKEEPATSVSMTAKQFQEIMQAVVFEARKPIIDEMKVAQTKRMRDHNRQMQKDQREMLINRFHSCNHMQLPGSVMTGCSCIAWATQSDGKRRGTCQHCGTLFSPNREECLSDEIWRAYPMLVRIPTHPGGNINAIFQSA